MMIPTADDIKTVTDLREETVSLLDSLQKKQRPTIIIHRNSPKAVMISVREYNRLLDLLEDYQDSLETSELITEYRAKKEKLIPLDKMIKMTNV